MLRRASSQVKRAWSCTSQRIPLLGATCRARPPPFAESTARAHGGYRTTTQT